MISESGSAARRLISLADLREEEVRFMFQSLAHRDDSNAIAALRIGKRHDDACEKAEGKRGVVKIAPCLARLSFRFFSSRVNTSQV